MRAKKYWILASLTGVILLSLMVVVLLMGANISANDKVIKKGIPDSAHKRANPTYSEVERLREKVKSLKVVIANRDEEIARQKRIRTRWGTMPGLRASLVGLRSVGIRVKDLPLTAVRHGLTKKNIVKAVKEEFQKHNIDTINVDTDPSEDSHEQNLVRIHILTRPQLHVEVICGTYEGGIYNAFITVSMESRSLLSYASEKVVQRRRGSAVRSEDRTTIWERQHVLVGKLDNFAEDERNSLEGLVDEFINDYLAANPKKEPTSKDR